LPKAPPSAKRGGMQAIPFSGGNTAAPNPTPPAGGTLARRGGGNGGGHAEADKGPTCRVVDLQNRKIFKPKCGNPNP